MDQSRYFYLTEARRLKSSSLSKLYSWDITRLLTNIRGRFFYFSPVIDTYSCKIVACQVSTNGESNDEVANIIREIARAEAIDFNQVTVHSDNGGVMNGGHRETTMLANLQALGMMPSFSQPLPVMITLIRNRYSEH